jgi:hypothetical protein
MKQYFISYQHITGNRTDKPYTDVNTFYQRLSELLEDKYVLDSSISFHTEEVSLEGLKTSELLAQVDEWEANKREQEYLQFRKFH